MKNLNESLLENIELIEEMQLQTELDVIFAIGNQYAKVGMIAEYSETDINEYDIIQESTLFMEADDNADDSSDKKDDNDKKDKKKGFWGKIKKFFSTIGKAIVKAFKWIGKQFKKLGKWVKSWFKKKDDDISNKEAAKMLDLGPLKNLDDFIEKKEEVVNKELTPEEAKQLVDEAEQIIDNVESKLQGDGAPEGGPSTHSVPQIGTSSDNDEALLAQELAQHKQELEQLKTDPEYQKNANAMADKLYEIVFRMDVTLRKTYRKFDRAYGDTSEANVDNDAKLLERIVYAKYKDANKDINFQNAVKAFANEFGIKEPTMTDTFMTVKDSEGNLLFLQKSGVSYDPDFLQEMLKLTEIINNFQEKNIGAADNYLNHICTSRVYYFEDLSEELVAQENEQIESLEKAVEQLEKFNPDNTAIESAEVARFATRLEHQALPHITTKLSEMAAYQNFLTSVFVEFRKQVTQNTQAKEGN